MSHGWAKATKTETVRAVDLTPGLLDALVRWQAEVEAEALMRGRHPGALIFSSDANTPLDASQVAKRFRGVLRVAGVPRFRLYDLRHTYATHLLAEGAPITDVAAQLGHAKPTTTLAHYAHWLPRGDRQWVERLSAARQGVAPHLAPNGIGEPRLCRNSPILFGEP